MPEVLPSASGVAREKYSAGALRTDTLEYGAVPTERPGFHAFTIVARYTNRTDERIQLEWCGRGRRFPIYGIVNAGPDSTGEGSAYNPPWPCVGTDIHLELEPGMTRVDTLDIRGPRSADGRTRRILGSMEGRFQLVYQVYRSNSAPMTLLPDSLRRSNTFTVRLKR